MERSEDNWKGEHGGEQKVKDKDGNTLIESKIVK